MKEASVPVIVLTAREDDVELVNQTLRAAGHAVKCHWLRTLDELGILLETEKVQLIAYFVDTLKTSIAQVAKARLQHSRMVPLIIIGNAVDENAICDAMQEGAQDMVSVGQRDRLIAVAEREMRSYRLEKALNETLNSASHYKDQLKNFMAGSVDAIAEVQEGIVVDANQAWAELLGHECPEMAHGPLMDYIDSNSQAALKGALIACANGRWDGTALKINGVRHEGSAVQFEIALNASIFDGEPSTKLAVRRPTETRGEPEAMVDRAIHADYSTGYLNRHRFVELLTDKLDERPQAGARALAFVRIDKFREIQDDIGPIASEEIIVQLANVIRQLFAQHDICGRLGGTVFATILERGTLRDIEAWARNAVERVSETVFEVANKTLSITCTIGIAEMGQGTDLVEPLLKNAEQANRLGRANGGNRVELEETSDASTRIKRFDSLWVHQIKSALVDGRFKLVHLGIASLSGKSEKILDTVLRMIDQQGDEVAAIEFMDTARRNELARPIDRWVIASSIAYCASNDCNTLFVKLSQDSLIDNEVVAWIARQCEQKSVAPSRICVQVSESDAAQFMQQTQALAEQLHAANFRFAIEHFGIGRDPLRILNQTKLDFIKIDGSLMQSLASNSVLQERVKSFVTAARHRRVATIAERVEDANTMAVLFQLGIGYMQGHYIHEPEVVLGDMA
jgi:diguanylate cyclase (GGDEF)-like protein